MNDVTVISHPRSGLTWLRLMCGVVQGGFRLGDPLFRFSHDGMGLARTTISSLHRRLNTDSVLGVFPRIKGHKVVMLLRDPRDVIFSNWMLLQKNASFHEFLRSKVYGISPLVEWLLWWQEHRGGVDSFDILRYEHMRECTSERLRWFLSSIVGLSDVSESLIDSAVATADVDRMRSLDISRIFPDVRAVVGDVVGPAKMGYWKNFEFEDQCFCESQIRRLDGTFAEVE